MKLQPGAPRAAARLAAVLLALAGAGGGGCSGGAGGLPPGPGGMISAGDGDGGSSSGGGSAASSGAATGASGSGTSSSGSGVLADSGAPAAGGSSGGSGAIGDSGGVGPGGEAGGSSGGSSSGSAGSSGGGVGAAIAFNPDTVVVTGVRGVMSSPAAQVAALHNGGPSAAQVTSLAIAGTDQGLFQIVNPPQFPMTLMPGGDLSVTIQMLTTGAAVPAAPPQDSGASVLTAGVTATSTAGAAQARLYGLVQTTALWEPTLGQILTTLGYKLNVGLAQNNANPNRGRTAQQLPGVEAGTDEVAAPLFVKAGAGSVTLSVVARFSPKGILPYGWYPPGNASTRNVVGTMDEIADPQTSNKARMVRPPLAPGSATSFDPGSGSFGIWVYSDELTQKYDTGNASNGDYDYTEDALNAPANVHRFKAYPLKDASGTSIAGMYLLAVEEATNGDYQDYVFVLGNVGVAP